MGRRKKRRNPYGLQRFSCRSVGQWYGSISTALPWVPTASQFTACQQPSDHTILPKAMSSFVCSDKEESLQMLGKEDGFPKCWAADAKEPCSLLSVFTLFNSCPLDHATCQAVDNEAVAGNTAKHLPTLL